jgi:hypothetical protein
VMTSFDIRAKRYICVGCDRGFKHHLTHPVTIDLAAGPDLFHSPQCLEQWIAAGEPRSSAHFSFVPS